MNTIQPRTQEKNAKNHLELTRKFQWKSCSITRLYFLPSDPKTFSTFRTKMKPSQYPKKETKKGKKRERTGGGGGREWAKGKSRDCCVTYKPNFAFCVRPNIESWYLASGTEYRMVLDVLRRFEPFWFFIARQWPENAWIASNAFFNKIEWRASEWLKTKISNSFIPDFRHSSILLLKWV